MKLVVERGKLLESKKVAIIFSTYNSSDYVGECVKSCLGQNYKNLVLVVSDDGSSDNTVSVLEKAAEGDERFFLIKLPHGERGIARAEAIRKAKALDIDYLYIIDSDMMLKDNLIEECVNYLQVNENIGSLVIPELAFSKSENFYSKVKVFERNILNNAGEELGVNSIEAARFWRIDSYNFTGGININQIAFEETQPTIRFVEKGGVIKRATFTGVYHDEKHVTLKNIVKKKKYYFSVMDKTINSEKEGNKKALSRWYFFRPVLYRKENLKQYLLHPILTLGMIFMYLVLTFVAVIEILKSKVK